MYSRGMYGITPLTAKDRDRVMGRRRPIESVMRSTERLLAKVNVETITVTTTNDQYVTKNYMHIRFEEVLHELAHHVCLEGKTVFDKRTRSLSAVLSDMSPVAADGNELDSIAVELHAAWWLGHPFSKKDSVKGAIENMSYFSLNAANRVVSELLTNSMIMDMGRELAKKIRDTR